MRTQSLEVRQITADETLSLRQAVLRPLHPLMDSRFGGDDDPKAGHFGVYSNEFLVGVGTVVPELCTDPNGDQGMKSFGAWRLRGMATDPEYRSLGAGTLVLRACLEHAEKAGASVVWANARTGAAQFYLRHGFQKMSAEYEMPGIGPHFLMKHELVRMP